MIGRLQDFRRRDLAFVLSALWAWPHANSSPQERFITLASTTSTEESGLFGHLIPIFRDATGIDVRVVAVGTGQALAIGARGDADALLVHDRIGEDKFVADGNGIDRRDVMYNDFVIVGPRTDPAGIKGLQGREAGLRQDRSRPRDLRLARRRQRHQSHGAAHLEIARPRAAWRSLVSRARLRHGRDAEHRGRDERLCVDRPRQLGRISRTAAISRSWSKATSFSSIPMAASWSIPAKWPKVKAEDARIWHEWLTSPAGRAAITSYRVNGEELFFVDRASSE